jgi:hypothetical protein
MQGETKERWKVLCEQVAIEQDPVKLLVLVLEIEDLLTKKQDRLRRLAPAQPLPLP